jgi:hypothetical protein
MFSHWTGASLLLKLLLMDNLAQPFGPWVAPTAQLRYKMELDSLEGYQDVADLALVIDAPKTAGVIEQPLSLAQSGLEQGVFELRMLNRRLLNQRPKFLMRCPKDLRPNT